MEFKTSDLKDKSVFLIGPTQNAQVEPHEYEDYDYVARMNNDLSCYDDPPRTDIVFLNFIASTRYQENINKNLNNKIIFTLEDSPTSLRKKYPTSVVISKSRQEVAHEKEGYVEGALYQGTHAMCILLKCGANVKLGGSDFYYEGFGADASYPPDYQSWTKNYNPNWRKETQCHKMSEDLNFIKNYLMVKFPEQLSMHEKTEHYFKKSLERYNIQ